MGQTARKKPVQFFIPSYQRGFRWTEVQVTQLLEDVWEFIECSENADKGAFYCLQPIVLRAMKDGRYEVVDGQQRLTTIFILLACLKDILSVFGKESFEITYETRDHSFLSDIDHNRAEENIDSFYMSKAYRAIESWFDKRDSTHRAKFLQHLIYDDVVGKNVKVIWFQLTEGDNPVSAFTRLNIGKIPLTNDELIKALFLKQDSPIEVGPTKTQIHISYEWDQLEKQLQNDSFWYFLNNHNRQGGNRIGFLFELLTENDELEFGKQHDSYKTFYTYNHIFKSGVTAPEEEWLKVKQTFLALEEWYEDRVLFHIVGFLIHEKFSVNEIRSLAIDITKSEFARRLKEIIFQKVLCNTKLSVLSPSELHARISEAVTELEYGRDSITIRSILLLFNVATLISNPQSNIRFQFDSFKKNEWDIEHVRSISTERQLRHHERIAWMRLCLQYLQDENLENELCSRISTFLQLSQSEVLDFDFDDLYDRILEFFKENHVDEADNGIGNLTLLDIATNRSYQNAVFAVKRQRILSLDKSGIFVPICTRNVFLKCYSSQVDNVMFWSRIDRESYQDQIIEVLFDFFNEAKEADFV